MKKIILIFILVLISLMFPTQVFAENEEKRDEKKQLKGTNKIGK